MWLTRKSERDALASVHRTEHGKNNLHTTKMAICTPGAAKPHGISSATNLSQVVSPSHEPECRSKRPAEHALLPNPRPVRPRLPNFHGPPSPPLPNPSSIRGLMREHNRERLYVVPLHWTSQHLQLLGCQFKKAGPEQQQQTNQTRQKQSNANQSDGAGNVPTYASRRDKIPSASAEETAMRTIASDLRCPGIAEFKTSTIRRLLGGYSISCFEQVPLISCDGFG